MSLQSVNDWLTSSSFHHFVETNAWFVPVTQSVHILAISIVMASIAMLDLRLAGFLGREQSVRGLTLRFYPWIWAALGTLATTGLLLVAAEPGRELANPIFWTKMVLVVLAVAVTMPIRAILHDCNFRSLPSPKRQTVRVLALTSLVLWLAIVVCGRWIAYF